MAEGGAEPTFYRVEIDSTVWEVPERYQELKSKGAGAFGTVCSALDKTHNIRVAIKKLARPFQTAVHAKRAYRELRYLKHMRHENIIGLLDVFTAATTLGDFQEFYLVTQLMDSDLNKVIKKQRLTDQQLQFLVYQILRGLKYIHSVGIIHRDLKPSNVAVRLNNELRIIDFGLARVRADEMTGYVATRYWRAPEIMLNWQHYETKVDTWSVGCIMAEVLTGQVLFPGNDHINLLTRIVKVVGSPDQETVAKITNDTAKTYLKSMPKYPRKNFSEYFLGATPQAVDLLEKLLVFDPDHRLTAEEALAHPYCSTYYYPDDEPTSPPIDDSFEKLQLDIQGWKMLTFKEIQSFVPNPELFKQASM